MQFFGKKFNRVRSSGEIRKLETRTRYFRYYIRDLDLCPISFSLSFFSFFSPPLSVLKKEEARFLFPRPPILRGAWRRDGYRLIDEGWEKVEKKRSEREREREEMIYGTLSKVDPDNKGPRDKPAG